MEFPVLFEEPECAEEKHEPVQPDAEPQAPGTALAVLSAPVAPVREIIRDRSVLRQKLDSQPMRPVSRIGEELVSEGLVTSEQVEHAIRLQAGAERKRIGEILVATGATSQDNLDFVLARRLGMPSVDLRHLEIDPDILAVVPKLLALKHMLMPCLIHKNRLVVAMANPMDHDALRAFEFSLGRPVLAVQAPKEDIAWAIEQRYRDLRKDKSPMDHWL